MEYQARDILSRLQLVSIWNSNFWEVIFFHICLQTSIDLEANENSQEITAGRAYYSLADLVVKITILSPCLPPETPTAGLKSFLVQDVTCCTKYLSCSSHDRHLQSRSNNDHPSLHVGDWNGQGNSRSPSYCLVKRQIGHQWQQKPQKAWVQSLVWSISSLRSHHNGHAM